MKNRTEKQSTRDTEKYSLRLGGLDEAAYWGRCQLNSLIRTWDLIPDFGFPQRRFHHPIHRDRQLWQIHSTITFSPARRPGAEADFSTADVAAATAQQAEKLPLTKPRVGLRRRFEDELIDSNIR